jgi:hypothetical protein
MNIDKAINKLAIAQDNTMSYEYENSIINEQDFNNINVHNNKSFNFTWADVQAKATELEKAEQQAKAQKEADALAGNNKLLELGLTQAQVTAMTGYTPPVSE